MENNLNEKKINLDILFNPVTIGTLKLANRIVMAPMTRGFSPNGVPGDNVAAYYQRRAENQVGLIITEGTLINHPAAAEGLGRPNFHGEAALKGWAQVVKCVHQAGGKIMPQLCGMLALRAKPMAITLILKLYPLVLPALMW